GTSIITEGVWDNRYRYTEELVRMGANIHVDGKIAVVEGVPELTAAPVRAYDLRAGAAMVIAGLAAKGTTQVEQVTNIERGYENLVEKFVGLGADMFRTEIPDSDSQAMPVAK
ncbi:MAG: UDP-N-acetylglucosamine 1-carboxyvinyltransferase, partial [Butyricicoccus sp.]